MSDKPVLAHAADFANRRFPTINGEQIPWFIADEATATYRGDGVVELTITVLIDGPVRMDSTKEKA